MIIKHMSSLLKIIASLFLFKILIINSVFATTSNDDFENWLISYKKVILKEGISQKTIDLAFKNVKFLDQVIRYDRKQPEFFEDTSTYVKKRATTLRANKAKELLRKNKDLLVW